MAVEAPPSRLMASWQPSWSMSSRICWMEAEGTLTSSSFPSAVVPTAVRGVMLVVKRASVKPGSR